MAGFGGVEGAAKVLLGLAEPLRGDARQIDGVEVEAELLAISPATIDLPVPGSPEKSAVGPRPLPSLRSKPQRPSTVER